MLRGVLLLGLTAGLAFGQYKTESAGAPPSELGSGITAILQGEGIRIVGAKGPLMEVWLRKDLPTGRQYPEEATSFDQIPQGALMGVIRYNANGQDRRGQVLKSGLYTLRYSMFPINGDHQGVAPQRDFLLVSPAASDQDAAATLDFDTLVDMSTTATGTPHPGVLSIWKASDDSSPGFEKDGDHDWVLRSTIGDKKIAIILIGTADH